MPKKRSTNTAIARRLTALEQKLNTLTDRHAPQEPAGKLHRAAMRIENFGLTRIFAALGIWLFVISIAGFVISGIALYQEREARREEAQFRKLAQVATAWELLLTRASGDIGKGNVVNTIIVAEGQLEDADLSCKNAGLFRDGQCSAPPHYNDVVLGDDDFWENDPERTTCDGPSCDTRSYLTRTNFEGAIISRLTAEKLLLDENFNGVIGRDWIVRDADFSTVFTIDDSGNAVEQNFAAQFECVRCWFFDSKLSWKTARNFFSATLERSIVVIPAGAPLDLREYWGFESFLDTPVVFHRAGLEEATLNHFFSRNPEPFRWAKYVEWDLYEYGYLCASEQDIRTLWPHLEDLAKKKTARANLADRATSRKLHIEDVKQDLRYGIVQPRYWPTTCGEALASHGHADPAVILREGRESWLALQRKAYHCRYTFEEVEPLLRKRVLERLNPDGED